MNSSDIYQHILNYRIPDLETGPNTIHPEYFGHSLLNVPATVAQLLDCPVPGQLALHEDYLNGLKEKYKHVVLLLVDGLGFNLLQSLMDLPSAQVYRDAVIEPMTSISPSTTAAAISSLWTGASPAEHGILGYEVYLREYGLIANMIQHNPASFNGVAGSLYQTGMKPQTFIPVPTLGSHFRRNGVQVQVLQPSNILNSGLTTMLFEGLQTFGYSNISDFWATLRQMTENVQFQRSYTYAYFSNIDELSHRYSPDDVRVRWEFDIFSQGLARFLESLPRDGDTVVLMLADHGQKTSVIKPEYNVRRNLELKQDLVMYPSGENRFAYFYAKADRLESLRTTLTTMFPGEMTVLNSKDAVAKGLFGQGEPYHRTWDRVGDLLTISNGDAYFWWALKENRLMGRHGGLSADEMLIPLIRFEI